MNVAIDGPGGAGKSSISRILAARFGWVYVDTGALYRAVGIAADDAGLAPDDAEGIAALCESIEVSLETSPEGQRTLLNGEDVSGRIRTERASLYASAVSKVPRVRGLLLETQRRIARENDVIMDGRDIATVILPDADVKIFLTASVDERARRRCEEQTARGEKVSFEEVRAAIAARDEQDSNRALAPLRAAPDAITVDTTGNTREQSVELLARIIEKSLAEAK